MCKDKFQFQRPTAGNLLGSITRRRMPLVLQAHVVSWSGSGERQPVFTRAASRRLGNIRVLGAIHQE